MNSEHGRLSCVAGVAIVLCDRCTVELFVLAHGAGAGDGALLA